jgi:hypothetical protein
MTTDLQTRIDRIKEELSERINSCQVYKRTDEALLVAIEALEGFNRNASTTWFENDTESTLELIASTWEGKGK